MFSIRRRHLLIGVLILLTLLTNAFVAFWNITRLVRNQQVVARTFETEKQIEQVMSLAEDIDNSQRSFVLTGNESFLVSFRQSKTQLTASLKTLGTLTSDPQQQKTLPLLRQSVARRFDLAHKAINIRRSRGGEAATLFVARGADKIESERIHDLASKMNLRADEVLTERTGESSDSAQDAFRTFWIATGANVVFLGFISGLLLQASRQNRQLARTVRDLKRSEELRSSLAAMLVHDLRTPLTTLLGPLQMLGDETLGPLDEMQKEFVAMSSQSGRRLLRMVNGLLDISKLEAGELKLSRTSFSLSDMLQSASNEARYEGNIKTAPITVEAPPDLKIRADHDLMERVVINLLSNALKFTPANGHIFLRAIAQEHTLRVEVQDSGEGIPPADIDRIFDKFGQVESRKSGRKNSTGLGLTFCKLAVEAHGGEIGVNSQLGHGSTFWFEIPLEASAVQKVLA